MAAFPPTARGPRTRSLAGDRPAPSWAGLPAASLRHFRCPCNVWGDLTHFPGYNRRKFSAEGRRTNLRDSETGSRGLAVENLRIFTG